MSLPVLVIITGPACTGKTTLGLRLAEHFDIPFFHKDGFKERMYEVIGERDGYDNISREESRQLGQMSIACLEIVMEALLARGQSVIVEANFDSALFSPRVNALRTRYTCDVVQVVLKTEGNTLLQRFIRRESEDRHPGHQGLRHLPDTQGALLRGECEPIAVDCDLLTFDTTDFQHVDFSPVWQTLERLLP